MAYTIEKTIKLTSRLGGITLSPDGSAIVGWDMLDELGGAIESRNKAIDAADVPRDITIAQLYEWADAKIVTEQTDLDATEAAAIAAKRAEGGK